MSNSRKRSSIPRRVSPTASKPDIHPIFELAESGAFQEVMDWIEREPELVQLLGWLDTTLLHVAVDKGNVEFTQFLLAKGADVNAGREKGALCWAKNAAVAKLLLDHGAIIPNSGSSSALSWACRYNRPDVVKLLLEYGALIDGTPPESIWSRHAPIFDAAENPKDSEDAECLRILIENGADINFHGTSYLDAAIYCAAMSGSISRFELLMAAGAKFERALLYNRARANVETYIESKYPELAQEEWSMSAEEISVQDLLVYSFDYVPPLAGVLSMASQMKFILWHVEDGMLQPSRGIQLRRFEIKNISLSVDGSHFVLPDEAGRVQIRSTSTLERIGFYQFPNESSIEYMQFSPCGNYLLAVPWDQQVIYILNLKTQAITTSPSHFTCQPISFSFAANPRLFSFLTMEQGGAESGIFRIEPDGTALLLEVYTGVEDGTSKIIFHPTLPVFMVNGKIYAYDDEDYLEMQPSRSDWWKKKNRFRAALKWRFDIEKLPRGSRYYFFKKYLLILSPQKLTYYTLGTGKIVAEHHFDFAKGESIEQHLIEIDKILLDSPQGFKLIDNPIQI